MNPDLLKTNTLAIATAGLLILLTGIIFYIYRDGISDNVRFVLPIPPLAVAAYIFVFNMYNHYDGKVPDGGWIIAREILLSTAIAAIAFGMFTLVIIGIINFIKG